MARKRRIRVSSWWPGSKVVNDVAKAICIACVTTIVGASLKMGFLYYQSTHEVRPLRVVIEPDLSTIYGERGGSRVEGTVRQKWGDRDESLRPLRNRSVTTVRGTWE